MPGANVGTSKKNTCKKCGKKVYWTLRGLCYECTQSSGGYRHIEDMGTEESAPEEEV